jgi:hypothetical protein
VSSASAGINRFKAHAESLPGHIKAALQPNLYLPALVEIARRKLHECEVPIAAAEPLLETIKGEVTGEGMRFSMAVPPGGGGGPGISVMEWVSEFKELREPRDFYQKDIPERGIVAGETHSLEAITQQVLHAFDHNPTPWVRTDAEGHGALNPTGLVAMAGGMGLPGGAVGTGPENAAKAATAILQEWNLHLRSAVKVEMQRQIRSAFNE